MPVDYPKRLIEVDLPIKRISAHARREKSIRHGHISTLHIWWARRPLAACRAVICAALWPDPADPLCPQAFRDKAAELMTKFAAKAATSKLAETCSPDSLKRWVRYTNNPKSAIANLKSDKQLLELRSALLDFIADFANWDNSTVKEYLETSRALTQAAHEALGGEPGTRPLVVDPFAGGGSIPLEALRVGADAFASDLNPVAVLLNKVVLEYIPKYGQRLADEVRKWGEWIKKEAEKELAEFYPKDPDGATPIAYLWARTIKCEGPGCGAEVPLMRSLWLAKKSNRSVALQMVANKREKKIEFKILERVKPNAVGEGTVRRGSITCPVCGYTTPANQMRNQLKKRHGGTCDARLVCVVTTRSNAAGRHYRIPSKTDYDATRKAKERLADLRKKSEDRLKLIPMELTPEGKGKGAGRAFSQRNYGMQTFADVYTDRQLLTLLTLARIIRSAGRTQLPLIVQILCALALGRVNDLSMSLCRWLVSLEAIAAANGGQNRMPVVLDFVESNPWGGSGGDWLGQIDWIARVVEHLQASGLSAGTTAQAPAQRASLPEDSAEVFFTDPPYYDAFPYSDLSDFFFIWLKRALGPEKIMYKEELVPKDDEIVVYDVEHGTAENKDRLFFQREMTKAFSAGRATTRPFGLGLVVFANKTTQGWESLIQSIIDAGWIATASWPIDTERPNRQRAIGSAALGSSVHVVCRPRENLDGSVRSNVVGDWREILAELPKRIHEWMPRLAQEGVVGADAIFACLGPALEIFSRYSRVEKASGEQVTLKEYLEHVWAAVAKEALALVFEGADTAAFEEDARLTAMWLWTLRTDQDGIANGELPIENGEPEDEDEEGGKGKAKLSGGYVLEYDAARKIAQGLGAHLEQLASLVEVKGDKARLLPVEERARYLFGKDSIETQSKRKKKEKQMGLFEIVDEAEERGPKAGKNTTFVLANTVLDRVHQSMLLFATGRSEALRRFLVDDGVGRDQRFWKLAQALSALYPKSSDEKRWVDGMLARKKGLGF